MNQFFAYTRVSTTRQGEFGVSLQQQREAIERYCQRQGLQIRQWFEEQETAAKHGRPVFSRMIRLLKCRSAAGVIIHKIDRSARNLRDWSDLGELIDQGIDVHFANESLDLKSRGGRLSADIQAVVAADFIRNLREETKKGFYGRLKQGLYPMPAPTGYLNCGKGQPKKPDPAKAPLIRRLFELYATGRYNLRTLREQATSLGLKTRTGKPWSLNGISKMLNNTFYIGLIHIDRTNESYAGAHEAIVPKNLFDQVQDILQGRLNTRTKRHDFLFRRRLTCGFCRRKLIGETHKGYVYYRCQTKGCRTTCIREEYADEVLLQCFEALRFSEIERRYFWTEASKLKSEDVQNQEKTVAALKLQLTQIEERRNRLTDAYIDRLVEKDLFEQRKNALLLERIDAEQSLSQWRTGKVTASDLVAEFLERANGAYLAYKAGNVDEKRDMVDALTSNCSVRGKTLEVTLKFPFNHIASRPKITDGSASRDVHRTWCWFLRKIYPLIKHKQKAQLQATA